jgi:hypothetical protein
MDGRLGTWREDWVGFWMGLDEVFSWAMSITQCVYVRPFRGLLGWDNGPVARRQGIMFGLGTGRSVRHQAEERLLE